MSKSYVNTKETIYSNNGDDLCTVEDGEAPGLTEIGACCLNEEQLELLVVVLQRRLNRYQGNDQ